MTKILFSREKSEVKTKRKGGRKMYYILRCKTYGRKPFWLKLIRFIKIRGLLR